jgi:RNA polymerase sigma-70 factor (ECF subfamily)
MPLLSADRALLDAFRAGDKEALERVYRHYIPLVSRFLRRGFSVRGQKGVATFSMTRAFELENAVQEVFVRAFDDRARLSYDGLRPYRDFLFGIAKHVALDELRKRTKDKSEPLDLDALPEPEGGGVEEAIAQKEAIAIVAAFLGGECDEKDRALFRLRFGEDASQESAAKSAGLTRIQVRRWETKFRTRLWKYLKRTNYV